MRRTVPPWSVSSTDPWAYGELGSGCPLILTDPETVIGLAIVSWPILLASSPNHRAPSEPVVMPVGSELAVGIGNSVTAPLAVIRPILLPFSSVNHKAPSGPFVIPIGSGNAEAAMGYSLKVPEVVIRPILLPMCSANHKAPSGPAVMPMG